MHKFASRWNTAQIICTILALTVAGCAGGDWPSLSDKMPDPQDRVLVRAEPSLSGGERDSYAGDNNSVLTAADAESLLHEVRRDLKAMKADYEAAVSDYSAMGKDSDETNEQELRHAWLNTQLHLTRMSQTVSRLNAILFGKGEALKEVSVSAQAFKAEIDGYIASEKLIRPAPTAG